MFDLIGHINIDEIKPYYQYITDWSLQDTLELRSRNLVSYDQDKLKFYNHCTIQTADNAQTAQTSDFVNVNTNNAGLVDLVQAVLGHTFRMRWAILEANQTLDWHIDPPTGDRFIIVTQGEHTVEVNTKTDTHSQTMLPGEVWYLNSNWYHRVINNTDIDRYAILGCFNYQV